MKFLMYTPVEPYVENRIRALRKNVRPWTRRTHDPLHSTVFLIDTDERQLPTIVDALSDVDSAPLRYETTGFDLFGDAFVLRCEKTPRIESLHVDVLDALRDVPKKRLTFGETEEERERERLYGSHYFGPQYTPHVTIARVTDDFDRQAVEYETLCWSADRLIIAEQKTGGWAPLHTILLE